MDGPEGDPHYRAPRHEAQRARHRHSNRMATRIPVRRPRAAAEERCHLVAPAQRDRHGNEPTISGPSEQEDSESCTWNIG